MRVVQDAALGDGSAALGCNCAASSRTEHKHELLWVGDSVWRPHGTHTSSTVLLHQVSCCLSLRCRVTTPLRVLGAFLEKSCHDVQRRTATYPWGVLFSRHRASALQATPRACTEENLLALLMLEYAHGPSQLPLASVTALLRSRRLASGGPRCQFGDLWAGERRVRLRRAEPQRLAVLGGSGHPTQQPHRDLRECREGRLRRMHPHHMHAECADAAALCLVGLWVDLPAAAGACVLSIFGMRP